MSNFAQTQADDLSTLTCAVRRGGVCRVEVTACLRLRVSQGPRALRIPAKKSSSVRSPRASALFRIFSDLHRMLLCHSRIAGQPDPDAVQGTPLCLSLPLLRGSLLHHATLRLPPGTRSVCRRSRCASDDGSTGGSSAPAPDPLRRAHWGGACPPGSRRRTDQLAFTRNRLRRGSAHFGHCSLPSARARQPG